jgi:hypothetical protein
MGGVTVFATNVETGEIYSAMTTSNGYYEITGLPSGTYRISADKVGYVPDNKEVTIGEGEGEETVEADMQIIAKTTSVRSSAFQLGIYPNPTTDKFTIGFEEQLRDVSFNLTDLSGKSILQRNIGTVQIGTEQTFDIGGLSIGTYILTIQSGEKTFAYPIVKK